jgi:multisubunit Na+/H+ antiporter MnhB subunit
MKKYIFVSLGMGILVAAFNTYLLGLLGLMFGSFYLATTFTKCHGETCLTNQIWVGDGIIIIVSLALGLLMGFAEKKAMSESKK